MTRLNKAVAFFAYLRNHDLLGPTLTQAEVDGCNRIVTAAGDAGWPISWTAYALATAYHETAHEMQPIKERGGDAYLRRLYDIQGRDPQRARKMGNTKPGDGVKFCGRGYVQITWAINYARADRELDLDGALIANPDLALRPDIAAKILILGAQGGWFTGRSMRQCLPSSGPATRLQFYGARRIINSLDRADDIAGYALEFQDALRAGDYR